MMIRVEIDGREYLPDQNRKIGLGYDASALSNVESGRSGVRVEITFPCTPQTAQLFGNAEDPSAAVRFNVSVHEASLRVGGTELLAGSIVLKCVRHNGCEILYEAEIVGNTSLWARSAALRKIADAGVEFKGALLPVRIRESWTDCKPVKFLPVYRDSYDVQEEGAATMPVQRVLMTDDYHPFLSVAAVVEAIFADAGYTVESRFFESDLFRSLYMSGDYSLPDASAKRKAMDFRAGRVSDATASANYFGRVYASELVENSSTGNIVETVEEFVTDSEGRTVSSGFYTNNRCFSVGRGEAAVFRPLTAVSVGFEYSLAYVTDYVIESRTRLKGFDSIHLGNGITVPFTIANHNIDQRGEPLPGYMYKLMIFKPESGYTYRLDALIGGVRRRLADTSARMTAVTMPSGAEITDMRLLKAASPAGEFTLCSDGEDWALYFGNTELTGRKAVEITLRTPAEQLSPSAPKRFDQIYFGGADPGMSLTLLKRTVLRPLFSGSAGYGSQLSFADVAGRSIRQIELLDALQHMFALQFCTDERTKRVFVEPYDDFFAGPVVDWRARVDSSSETVIVDPSPQIHERMTFGYADGDGTVTRFDNEHKGGRFGRWSFDALSKTAAEGEKVTLNPLFAPTLNAANLFKGTPSALIMQVQDRDDDCGDSDGSVTPRIVRYAGMHQLPKGECWCYPSEDGQYPLAAFHFAGDDGAEGFSLCFENRDGIVGLHRYHDRRLREIDEGLTITLSLRITHDEIAGLSECRSDVPSVRSRFLLTAGGRDVLCTLLSIENYDPRNPVVRCKFRKIVEVGV